MKRSLIGHYQTSTLGQETMRAFVPAPLPSQPPLEIDEQAIRKAKRRAATTLQVFAALQERPLINLNQICRRTGLSFPAAAKAMEELLQMGIAREITGRKRDRVFAYDAYLKILSEGAEPL